MPVQYFGDPQVWVLIKRGPYPDIFPGKQLNFQQTNAILSGRLCWMLGR